MLLLTDEGVRLVDAAEQTFTSRVTELVEGALDQRQVGAVAEVLTVLRAALERDRIGMPTG